MADRQRAGITGNATMRVPITGDVNVGGRAVRELRFMPRSAFPEVGRSDVLYIDTLGECIYYWNGGEYVQLSGGGSGTDNYNSLQNRPKINNVTLEGEQTSSDLGLQSSIDDLSSIRSGASAGATALQPEDVDTLPTDGSSNPVSSGGTYDFVNSSIATNTAYFIGTFASVAELEAYTGTVTNNDYAFVTSTDSAGNTLYNRYKYNAATQTWSFEYAVNNTAFTTAQWAAIQSGMTSADKTKLDGIEQGANKTVIDASPTSGSDNAVSSGGVHTALSGKQDTIADLSDIRSGASAGATAVQPSALNDYQTKLSGTNKLDPSYIDYDASHRAVSDTEKSTWNGKQDAISDLSTIRSGAAAGATALQQSDVSSTYSASGTAPVNGTAVNAAIGTLDVSSVGGSGKYISAISEADGKIAATPTTMDTTPTANSTVPVTSGGVAASQAVQDAEIAWNVNQGVKNLLRFDLESVKSLNGGTWSGNANTINGVTITINDTDKTISFVKTGSGGDVYFRLTTALQSILSSGSKYILSGATGGSSTTFYLGNSGNWENMNGDTEITYTGSFASIYVCVKSTMPLNTTITIKPMIRPASITDPTFQPYALPNPTLTPAVIKAVDEGAKNLFDYDVLGPNSSNIGTSVVVNGVRFTMNSDKSVTITRESSSSQDSYVWFRHSDGSAIIVTDLCDDGHVFSGATGASASTYRLYINNINGSGTYKYFGDGEVIGTPQVTPNAAGIFIAASHSPSNLVIKPIICTAADWAVSQKFVPYAMSNVELTVEVKNITPTIIKDQSTSVGTSYTLISSLTQTTTSGKLCRISAIIAYRNYRPRGIVLSYSNDSSNFDTGDKLIAKTETAGDSYELSASAIISRNNIPVYVWAKAATVGAERIYSIMEQLGDL